MRCYLISWIDNIIVFTFLFGLVCFGWLQGLKNKTSSDYFSGNRNVPWIIAMFSIVATETSVLTFISIPGIAYREDWTFLQLGFGYILGRVLVSFLLLPKYFENSITSIYEVIGEKFGSNIQKTASFIFLITRVFADGIRFLATAVIVQVITGWSLPSSVLIIGVVTLVYSLLGGIKTIVWIDSVQFILYLLGGVSTIIFILNHSSESGYQIASSLYEMGKLKTISFSGNVVSNPYYFISAVVGGAFLSLSSHGVDHMMVQRVLITKDLKSAKKAMIGSGVFVVFQFFIFLIAGSLIYYFYQGISIEKDREFSTFIVQSLPMGLKGLLMAGILSAAMSTLSSSINSLASSVAVDWYRNSISLVQSKWISLVWALVLISIALLFDESDSAIIIIGLQIASFTYGGLLGLFVLSKIQRHFRSSSVIIGLISSFLIVFYLKQIGIAWTWFILIATSINVFITLLIDYSHSFLSSRKR